MIASSGAGWRMLQGDSLIALRSLPDDSIDAVVTDPPYSSGGAFRGDRQAASSAKYVSGDTVRQLPEVLGDNRDQRGFLAWCSLWLAECLRVAKDGAAIAVFTDWRQLPTTTDAVMAGGWCWRGVAPWCKPNARPQAGRLRQSAEFIVWGSKGAMPFDRDAGFGPGYWLEDAPREREHMTEKPIGVMRDLVKICENGGTVMDPFAGSATTGVAALLEGRKFLGLELSEDYYQIACRRLAETEAGVDRGSIGRGQPGLFGGAR